MLEAPHALCHNFLAMEKKNQTVGTLLTLCGAALWGLCAVAAKYLMSKGMDTVWMVNFRMFSAGLIMLAWAALKNPKGFTDIWKKRNSVLRLLVIALLGFDVCQITYFLAIQYCNAGIATAIQQTAPVFILVFVIIKEHRLPTKLELLVLFLVMTGSFILSTGGNLHALSVPAIALFYGFTSAITCTLYIMLPGKLIDEHGTFETIGWGMTIGGIIMMPVSRFWIVSGSWDLGTCLAAAFIVLLGAVAAFGTFLYGTTIVGPVKAGIYGLFEPVVATFASLIFLGQAFSASDYIGIALILAGITVLSVFNNKNK